MWTKMVLVSLQDNCDLNQGILNHWISTNQKSLASPFLTELQREPLRSYCTTSAMCELRRGHPCVQIPVKGTDVRLHYYGSTGDQ